MNKSIFFIVFMVALLIATIALLVATIVFVVESWPNIAFVLLAVLLACMAVLIIHSLIKLIF